MGNHGLHRMRGIGDELNVALRAVRHESAQAEEPLTRVQSSAL